MKRAAFVLCSLILLSFLASFKILRVEALSTISTGIASSAMDKPWQRKNFYANGLHWAWYVTSTGFGGWRTSSDGATWSSFTSAFYFASGVGGEKFSVWHDGVYVHYARSNVTDYTLFYRRGLTDSSGSISWSASEQTVMTTGVTADAGPFISVDSEGYPWISFYSKTNATCGNARIVKSQTKDGTWNTASSFPYNLTDTRTVTYEYTAVIPLIDSKLYAMTYGSAVGEKLKGKLWNGSSWSSLENATATSLISGYQYSVVAINDDLYITYIASGAGNIMFTKRLYSTGSWSAAETVESDASYKGTTSCPVLTYDDRNFYVFWAYADKFYYKSLDRQTNTWQVSIKLLSDDIQNDQVITYYKSLQTTPSLYWKRPSPTSVKFDSYALDFDGIQIRTTNATINSAPEYTTGNFTFTITGDAETVTSTTIYMGDKGKPEEIRPNQADGGWNETGKIQTILWTHASDQEIQLLWDVSGSSGRYNVQITVSINHLPTPNAIVQINGENKTTDLFGQTTWQLPFGDYIIWAYCQGKNQSQAVSINQDRTLGFNFTNPILPLPPDNIRNILIVAVIAVAAIMFLTFIKRRR